MTEQKKGIIRRFFGGIGRAISWLRVVMLNLVFVVFLIVFLTAFLVAARLCTFFVGVFFLVAGMVWIDRLLRIDF